MLTNSPYCAAVEFAAMDASSGKSPSFDCDVVGNQNAATLFENNQPCIQEAVKNYLIVDGKLNTNAYHVFGRSIAMCGNYHSLTPISETLTTFARQNGAAASFTLSAASLATATQCPSVGVGLGSGGSAGATDTCSENLKTVEGLLNQCKGVLGDAERELKLAQASLTSCSVAKSLMCKPDTASAITGSGGNQCELNTNKACLTHDEFTTTSRSCAIEIKRDSTPLSLSLAKALDQPATFEKLKACQIKSSAFMRYSYDSSECAIAVPSNMANEEKSVRVLEGSRLCIMTPNSGIKAESDGVCSFMNPSETCGTAVLTKGKFIWPSFETSKCVTVGTLCPNDRQAASSGSYQGDIKILTDRHSVLDNGVGQYFCYPKSLVYGTSKAYITPAAPHGPYASCAVQADSGYVYCSNFASSSAATVKVQKDQLLNSDVSFASCFGEVQVSGKCCLAYDDGTEGKFVGCA